MEHNFVREPAGYLRIDPLPSKTELADYYSSDYYQNPHGTYSSIYTVEELQHKTIRNEFLFRVFTMGMDENGTKTFLDVGCGEGFLLSTFHKNGWETLGLDFSSFGVAKFNSHLSGNLVVGDIYDSLEKLIAQNRKFNCINLGNVLEHVLDPISLLVDIRKLMSPSSVLAITVPNDFSRLQTYLYEINATRKQYWVAAPDHLNYFGYESLRETAVQAGLQYVDVLADFPIEWFLANDRSNYSLDPSFGKSAHFARVKLDSLITSAFDFDDIKNFWSSMAKVGQGRVVTLLCKRLDS